jgi:hypothetical protein
MDLYTKITDTYPELIDSEEFDGGCIQLKDDGDGVQYIAKWEYGQPLPEGLKIGK